MPTAKQATLSDADYQRLLEFRVGLRRFLRWSEEQASGVHVTPAHHQLLLAIRGHADPQGPTVGDVAEALLLRHHSAVELIDRAVAAGLIKRTTDAYDLRIVRLRLTANGARKLEQLAARHVEELARIAPRMRALWEGIA
jgi:DNA-binding MarR family transcriptional regulator